ncbi:MAG: alkaline phosphatase [Bacteroidota bacterium]
MIKKNNIISIRLKTTALLLVLGFVISSFTYTYVKENEPAPRVKKIILMIGDGMGITQVSAAMAVSEDHLHMTTTRHIGFIKTQSYDDYTTDSAASGTAMATGTKTRNGMIGMDPDSNRVANISELIRDQKNMSYGVVSTSAVTHATPASFVAHIASRADYESIALEFVRNQPDVFIGGGKSDFADRTDKRNLIKLLENDGYEVAYTMDELNQASADKVAGLLADDHMPRFSGGRDYMLSEATRKAIQLLDRNKNGFFLMVEGSQIDWAGHANDALYLVEETLDFDIAVGVALRFAARDRNTLVIVTADHECGGMALPDGILETNSIMPKFATTGHTGVIVPVFAFGAGAEEFTGFYDNTDLFKKMSEAMRLR